MELELAGTGFLRLELALMLKFEALDIHRHGFRHKT